jgi:hypothetical protein
MQERKKEKRRNFSAVTRVKILGYADETCGSNRQLSSLCYNAIDTITKQTKELNYWNHLAFSTKEKNPSVMLHIL